MGRNNGQILNQPALLSQGGDGDKSSSLFAHFDEAFALPDQRLDVR